MISKKYQDLYLSTTIDQLNKLSSLLLYLEKKSNSQNLLENIFRLMHSMKGAAATMSYKKTVNLMHTMENVIDAAYHNDLEINKQILDTLFNTVDLLKENIKTIKKTGRETDLQRGIEDLRKILSKKVKTSKLRKAHSKREKHILGTLPTVAEVSIPTERLDQLSTSFDDLLVSIMEVKARANKIGDAKLLTGCLQVDKFLGDIRRQLKNVRIVPLSQILSSLPYLIREVARNENKEVDLVIKDNDLALDKAILDELVEILIQLLKNSVSHGIAEGQKKAKIILEVSLAGDRLQVRVEDNGRGIKWQDILDMAVKNKIISRAASKKMTLGEIKNLIFQPGISKGKVLTTVSGRGIGLSLVKSKVSELDGTIEIESKSGKGTAFIINLPLPMSVFRSVVFQAGDYHFAVPMTNIDKLLQLDEVKSFAKAKTYTNKRSKFKLVFLHNIMKLPKFSVLYKYVVLLKHEDKKLALPVAANVTEEELIMKKTPLVIKGKKYIKGVAVSASGRPILVLDINSFK